MAKRDLLAPLRQPSDRLFATFARLLKAGWHGLSRLPRERLILFTRYPVPGRTKTRLMPALGPEGAAELQRRMAEGILRVCRGLEALRRLQFEVRYAGGSAARMRDWLGDALILRRQEGRGLGGRMGRALERALGRGVGRAVLVGSDCPGLRIDILQKAFEALRRADLVFGPAADGGYYLVGTRRSGAPVFEGIDWGTDRVLSQTLERARGAGLSVELVDELVDVDTPEDLEAAPLPGGSDGPRPRISVVIPAVNEESDVADAIQSARKGRGVELLLCDGGSTDRTVEVARTAGAQVLETEKGRARQMNAGAARAAGPYVLFLHADTRLPWGWDLAVRRLLHRPEVAAGAFMLGLDGSGADLRTVEWLVNLRSRYLGVPYGDQALFLRKETFQRLGGFREMPIMEDYEMVGRLRREGRVSICPLRAVTSARRWQELGLWRTSVLNKLVTAGYHLGVPSRILARIYRGRSAD